MKMKKIVCILFFVSVYVVNIRSQQNQNDYLKPVLSELQKEWPKNKTINFIFHGHSVPAGYFRTPVVNSLESYPFLTLKLLKTVYPTAVINVINTSIGGENSAQGEKRFKKDVLSMRPDIIFIDYALNDRNIGLETAENQWRKMIKSALVKGIKIILLTPTPDLNEDITDENSKLSQYARMIRKLADEYQVGLVDSYLAFKQLKINGENLNEYMAQNNHPNAKGHQVVAEAIFEWFEIK